MANLIRMPRAKWRTLPPGPLVLNEHHWLVDKGIGFYFPVPSLIGTNGRHNIFPISNTLSTAFDSIPICFANGSSSATYNILSLDFPFTLLAWVQADYKYASQVVVSVRREGATTGYHALRLSYNATGPQYKVAASSFNGTATHQSLFDTNYLNNTWIFGAAIFTSATYRLAGQDGVFSTTSSTTSVTRLLDNTVDIAARSDSGSMGLYLTGSVYNILALPYSITANDFLLLYQEQKNNPWGLVKARRDLFISIPGVVLPTLSSPTAINITSSGFQPRVTATY